jgi:hypothetical protein
MNRLLIVSVVGLVGCAPSPRALATGIVTIDPVRAERATVVRGTIVKREFLLRNNSDQVISVSQGDTGCFSRVLLPAKRIGEHMTMKVVAEFDTRFGAVDGINVFEAQLRTDIQGLPVIHLVAEAQVEPEFIVEPRVVNFDDGRVVQEVIVTLGNTDATLKSVQSTDESFTATLRSVVGSKPRCYRVEVRRKVQSVAEPFGNLVIATTSTVSPELRIPLRKRESKTIGASK